MSSSFKKDIERLETMLNNFRKIKVDQEEDHEIEINLEYALSMLKNYADYKTATELVSNANDLFIKSYMN